MKTLLPTAFLFCALLAVPVAAFSQTWTQSSGVPITNLMWNSVCSSADGNQIFAVSSTNESPYSGPMYQSFDSGQTWTTNTMFNRPWVAIASSADGSRLAAVGANDSVIYLSTNSGATWGHSPAISETRWYSLASSADGNKLVGVGVGGVYTSTNSGTNWSPATGTLGKTWTSVASSADGSKLVAAALNDSIYTSADSGNSWTSNNLPNATWVAVACSADGNKLAAAAGGFNLSLGPICLSTNFGTAWTTSSAPVLDWAALASSADGRKLIALRASGRTNSIFTSTDCGVTWMSNTVPADPPVYVWNSVASSADGNKLVAASDYSGVWTWQSTPAPQLDLASSSDGLKFSWIVPSTNFVLQQNSDLTTANWVTLTNTPTLNLNNLNDELVLSPSNFSCFFRLRAQ